MSREAPPDAMTKTDDDLLDFLKTSSRAGSWSGLICDRVLQASIDDFVTIMDNHCYKARISKGEIRERATNGTLIGIKLEQTAEFQDGTAPTYDVVVLPEVGADAQMLLIGDAKMIGRFEARDLIAKAFGVEADGTLAETVEALVPGWLDRMAGGVPTYKRTSDGVLMIQKTDTPVNRSNGTVGTWCATSAAKGRLTLDRETTAEVIADLADLKPTGEFLKAWVRSTFELRVSRADGMGTPESFGHTEGFDDLDAATAAYRERLAALDGEAEESIDPALAGWMEDDSPDLASWALEVHRRGDLVVLLCPSTGRAGWGAGLYSEKPEDSADPWPLRFHFHGSKEDAMREAHEGEGAHPWGRRTVHPGWSDEPRTDEPPRDGAYQVQYGTSRGVAMWTGSGWAALWMDFDDCPGYTPPGDWPDGDDKWTWTPLVPSVATVERVELEDTDKADRHRELRKGVMALCGFDAHEIADTKHGDEALMECLADRIRDAQAKALHFSRESDMAMEKLGTVESSLAAAKQRMLSRRERDAKRLREYRAWLCDEVGIPRVPRDYPDNGLRTTAARMLHERLEQRGRDLSEVERRERERMERERDEARKRAEAALDSLILFRHWARKAVDDEGSMSDDELRECLDTRNQEARMAGLYLSHWHALAERIAGPVAAPTGTVPRDAQLRTVLDLWAEDTHRRYGKAILKASAFRQWMRAHSGLPTEATDGELRDALTARIDKPSPIAHVNKLLRREIDRMSALGTPEEGVAVAAIIASLSTAHAALSGGGR